MADAQLQHDADPDTLVSQLAAFQALAQLGHPLPVASVHKQVDNIAVDLSKLPPPPISFPKDIKDCFDVAIALQLRSSKNWVTSPSVKLIFMDSQSLSQSLK